MVIEVKGTNVDKRPSATFAALYRFHSFLDIRTRLSETLDNEGLRCLTINLLQRVIEIWYERKSEIEKGYRIYGECRLCALGPNGESVYAKLIPCNADHTLPVSASNFPESVDPQIFIYLDDIRDGLGITIERLSKELDISKDASEALVESIIVAHEIQHCLVNTTLLLYSFRKNVDFVDTVCAEYLSEKLVDHTLMRTLPMTFESLGIEPNLFKSVHVLNLLNSLKSSGDIILNDLVVVAKYIAKNLWSFQGIIYAIRDSEVRKMLSEVWKRLFIMGGTETEAKKILWRMLRNSMISTKRLINALENDISDFNDFVKSIDTSRYRVLDKACTALRLNTSRLLYLWDKGMINEFIEALIDMGVLRASESDDIIATNYKYLMKDFSNSNDLKVFEELRNAKIRNVAPDLKSYIERVVLASSASGMVKTFYWSYDPKDPMTVTLKDIKPLMRVSDKRKVKSALVINSPIIDNFFDYGVVREIKRRLKELSITVYEVNDVSERPPLSSYVFFITSTWTGAESAAQKLYSAWSREIALSVLIAYPDAPFPPEEVLKSWKRVSKHVYFVSLYDFDDLRLSRVYSYKEALVAAKRGSF